MKRKIKIGLLASAVLTVLLLLARSARAGLFGGLIGLVGGFLSFIGVVPVVFDPSRAAENEAWKQTLKTVSTQYQSIRSLSRQIRPVQRQLADVRHATLNERRAQWEGDLLDIPHPTDVTLSYSEILEAVDELLLQAEEKPCEASASLQEISRQLSAQTGDLVEVLTQVHSLLEKASTELETTNLNAGMLLHQAAVTSMVRQAETVKLAAKAAADLCRLHMIEETRNLRTQLILGGGHVEENR